MRRIKRFAAVLCTAAVISTAFCGASAAILKRGDADLDGEVTILDATRIQRVLAELYEDTDGSVAKYGDVTGDGLDIMDATAIQRYIAELGNPYHIGEPIEHDPQPATQSNQLPVLN